MGRWTRYQRSVKQALHPRACVLVSLLLFSAAGLAAVFTRGLEQTAGAYVVYALSAYTTAAAIFQCVILVQRGRALLHQNPFFLRYKADLDFRTTVSLRLSLGITLFYCTYKSFIAVRYRSPWFGSEAAYYLTLTAARLLLLRHVRGSQTGPARALRLCRVCGYLLLLLTMALGAMGFYMIYEGKAARYPGHIIYAVAGIAFYHLITAVVSLARYRKQNAPIYSASKILALAAASVSMFFLQVSMFDAFGDGGAWQRSMNLGTGGFVFLVIISMALFMIWSNRRSLAAPAPGQRERA